MYTLQCSRESSQRCSVRCNTLSDPPIIGVNVSDESALHRVHSHTSKNSKQISHLPVYKIVIVVEAPVDESVSQKL